MSNRAYTLLVIAILKGGARKTTTAMMLGFALSRRGMKVLVIDADTKTQGVTDWASDVYTDGGELPFDVVQWAPAGGELLIQFVKRWQGETGADVVIVDVGGEQDDVLKQAAKTADLVISPVGAEKAEIAQLGRTKAVIGNAPMRVMLTRVPDPKRGDSRAARMAMVADGYQVLRTETRRNIERYSKIYGTVPDDLDAYGDLADEILELEV